MQRTTYLDLLEKYGVDSAHPGGLPLTKIILNMLSITNNTKLLDLGCGTGQTLSYIARSYPCKVIGADINKQMLNKASQRFYKENLPIELVCTDIMQMPFPSNTFDIALSESVTVFTNINKALREYARVLKTGGILIAVEMTAISQLTRGEINEIKSVYGVSRIPTANEWDNMFRQAGFKDIRIYDAKIKHAVKFTSLKMVYDFLPHLNIIRRFSRKLGYRVYLCKK